MRRLPAVAATWSRQRARPAVVGCVATVATTVVRPIATRAPVVGCITSAGTFPIVRPITRPVSRAVARAWPAALTAVIGAVTRARRLVARTVDAQARCESAAVATAAAVRWRAVGGTPRRRAVGRVVSGATITRRGAATGAVGAGPSGHFIERWSRVGGRSCSSAGSSSSSSRRRRGWRRRSSGPVKSRERRGLALSATSRRPVSRTVDAQVVCRALPARRMAPEAPGVAASR